jgi:hypothetical protein
VSGDILLLTFRSLVTDVYILILLYSGSNVKILYGIRYLVGNNNNGIVNCIFYLTKESNQPEDGSLLEPKHVVERNNVRNTP